MGTNNNQFEDPELLENIESLEARLLEYEAGLDHGTDNTSLVPVIFRYAHNLKSSLGMLGFKDASGLVHQVESCFDLVRNARKHATPALVKATLKVVDVLRTCLSGPDEPFPDTAAIVTELGAFVSDKASEDMSVSLPFTLKIPEAAAARDALWQGKKLRLLESLIFTNLSEAVFSTLPCFEQASRAGELVAWHPHWHEIPHDRQATVISLLIASSLEDSTFGKTLGSPWRPVRQPDFKRLYCKEGLAPDTVLYLQNKGFLPLEATSSGANALVITAAGSPWLTDQECRRSPGRLVLAIDLNNGNPAALLDALDKGADAYASSVPAMEREIRYLESLFMTGFAGQLAREVPQ